MNPFLHCRLSRWFMVWCSQLGSYKSSDRVASQKQPGNTQYASWPPLSNLYGWVSCVKLYSHNGMSATCSGLLGKHLIALLNVCANTSKKKKSSAGSCMGRTQESFGQLSETCLRFFQLSAHVYLALVNGVCLMRNLFPLCRPMP